MPMPAYVNSGTAVRLIVSSVAAVSGLTLAPPGSLVVGNLLVVHVAARATANITDDAFSITQASGVWSLLFDDIITGVARNLIWAKFVTAAAEANVNILVSAVGTGGNTPLYGVIHQFSNVLNPGTVTYAEAAALQSGNASGIIQDADITTSDANRLAVNFVYTNNVGCAPSLPWTGAAGGTWTVRFYSATAAGQAPQIRLITADMVVAGTVGGGQSAAGSAGSQSWGVRGFAFAPCGAAVVPTTPEAMHHYIMHMGNH